VVVRKLKAERSKSKNGRHLERVLSEERSVGKAKALGNSPLEGCPQGGVVVRKLKD